MAIPSAVGRERITIAILALGGQGGGVLADWILAIARNNGFVAQGTSVPGVAQRTGSTIYYLELVPRGTDGAAQPDPVMALMPVPGDVDIVIASELMEAGRAILRGFVSDDRTTLIGSTHRIYAIAEKSAPGDGTGSSERIIDAAGRRAARFISFDMEAAAQRAGSVISSVMLGALAASEALPFSAAMFERAIREGGKAVEANLQGFAEGVRCVGAPAPQPDAPPLPPEPTTAAGSAIKARIRSTLPPGAWDFAIRGAARMMDYQDAAYADAYLDRIAAIHACDDGRDDWRLTREAARHVALWMAYDDTIRVADLKIRATRSTRVQKDLGVAPGQILSVTEYMHPRLREVCEMLPGWAASAILRRKWLCRRLEPLFTRGRFVQSTSLRWFLLLRGIAGMRRWRRTTLRYAEEQQRIDRWLACAMEAAETDTALAAEVITLQRLIKGYADTFERSLARFEAAISAARRLIGQPDSAGTLRSLSEAALKTEEAAAFGSKLAAIGAV